jgi:hypothetical protein
MLAPLCAESGESPRVRAVMVQGLTRTKLSVVEPYYSPYIGKPWGASSREELVQELRGIGLFHSIEIFTEPAGEDIDIIIALEEKWTLIPLPFAVTTQKGTMGGIIFLESNFLGYNKQIYAGGVISTQGDLQGMVAYTDPKIFGTDFSGNFFFSGGINETQLVTKDDKVWHEYATMDYIVRTGISREIFSDFSLGAGAGFLDRWVDKDFSRTYSPPDSVRFITASLTARYKDLTYGEVLSYGAQFSGSTRRFFSLRKNVDSYTEYEASLRYHKELPGGHRLGFFASGTYIPGAPFIQEKEMGGKLFKTLPEGFPADCAAYGQISCELITLRFSSLVFTLLAAYEAEVFSLNGSPPETSQGPGGGFRLYLSKVAFPALGADVSYNVKTRKTYASVFMGVSY